MLVWQVGVKGTPARRRRRNGRGWWWCAHAAGGRVRGIARSWSFLTSEIGRSHPGHVGRETGSVVPRPLAPPRLHFPSCPHLAPQGTSPMYRLFWPACLVVLVG